VRHAARIAGFNETEDEQELALAHNISATGALFLTGAVYEVTEKVKVTLYLPGGKEKTVTGTVKRCERFVPGRAELWQYQVAVRFDEVVALGGDVDKDSDVKASVEPVER
jgi:hypothetical protein